VALLVDENVFVSLYLPVRSDRKCPSCCCVILFAARYGLLTITHINTHGRSNLLVELLVGLARNEFPSGQFFSLAVRTPLDGSPCSEIYRTEFPPGRP
jgi:hypothetical protein